MICEKHRRPMVKRVIGGGRVWTFCPSCRADSIIKQTYVGAGLGGIVISVGCAVGALLAPQFMIGLWGTLGVVGAFLFALVFLGFVAAGF